MLRPLSVRLTRLLDLLGAIRPQELANAGALGHHPRREPSIPEAWIAWKGGEERVIDFSEDKVVPGGRAEHFLAGGLVAAENQGVARHFAYANPPLHLE